MFAPVGTVDSGAELPAVGAIDEGLFGVVPEVVVGVGVEVTGACVCIAGLSGDTGDVGLVGLLIDFLQASDVVTQGP